MDSRLLKRLSYVAVFLVSLQSVLAKDIGDYIFDPFGGFNLGGIYASMPYFFDAVIYILIFFGLSKFVFSKTFAKRGDKLGKKSANIISLGVGLALTFAMMMFSINTGFTIGDLHMFAAAVFIFLAGFLLYQVMRELMHGVGLIGKSGIDKAGPAALTFLFIYYGMMEMIPGFPEWLYSLGFFGAALNILVFIALVLSLIWIFSFFGKLGGGKREESVEDRDGPTWPERPEKEEETSIQRPDIQSLLSDMHRESKVLRKLIGQLDQALQHLMHRKTTAQSPDDYADVVNQCNTLAGNINASLDHIGNAIGEIKNTPNIEHLPRDQANTFGHVLRDVQGFTTAFQKLLRDRLQQFINQRSS